jgi:hypothetical protein
LKYDDDGWDVQLGKGSRKSYRVFLWEHFAKPQPVGEPTKKWGDEKKIFLWQLPILGFSWPTSNVILWLLGFSSAKFILCGLLSVNVPETLSCLFVRMGVGWN